MAICWQDIESDAEKYAAYLCSREWAEKREAVRERCGGLCERCGLNPMDATHHLTYIRKYDEALEDLQGICNDCHAFTHGKSPRDPIAKLIIETMTFGKYSGGRIKCPCGNDCYVKVKFFCSTDFADDKSPNLDIVFNTGCDRRFRLRINDEIIAVIWEAVSPPAEKPKAPPRKW